MLPSVEGNREDAVWKNIWHLLDVILVRKALDIIDVCKHEYRLRGRPQLQMDL